MKDTNRPEPPCDEAYQLEHEWKKRSPALDDTHELDNTELVITQVNRLAVPNLINLFPDLSANHFNKPKPQGFESKSCYFRFVQPDEVILSDIIRHTGTPTVSSSFVRAGPRERLFFDPNKVTAGIVTCGGLCPGLNNVIREIVRTLFNLYDVEKVYGFVGGFGGIYEREPVVLTEEAVDDIHHKGGTILSSNRGGFDEEKIYKAVKGLGISQFYIIGGDGTMRGAQKLSEYFMEKAKEEGSVITVAGVPKTIDNDIDLVDRSFGFQTAVTEALHAIHSAKTEAQCAPWGVGVVKLMGRQAGFIAAHASLASGDVDLCLIPECPILVEGEGNIFDYLFEKVKRKGHAVVVVAEGAGEEILGAETEVDAGGNRKLPAIGYYLKLKIREFFATKGVEATVKYIDPSYMIRSVPANASDAVFCLILAQNVVHGAMAGYTGFCVALCNNRTCYLPMKSIVAYSPRQIDVNGRTYDRLLALTGQPRVPWQKNPHLATTPKTIV